MKNHMFSLIIISTVMFSQYDATQASDSSGSLKGFHDLLVGYLKKICDKIQPPRGSWQCPNGGESSQGVAVEYDEVLRRRDGW